MTLMHKNKMILSRKNIKEDIEIKNNFLKCHLSKTSTKMLIKKQNRIIWNKIIKNVVFSLVITLQEFIEKLNSIKIQKAPQLKKV